MAKKTWPYLNLLEGKKESAQIDLSFIIQLVLLSTFIRINHLPSNNAWDFLPHAMDYPNMVDLAYLEKSENPA